LEAVSGPFLTRRIQAKTASDDFLQIEEERRRDVDNANTKRTEFNEREKEMTDLETAISIQRQRLAILAIDHRQSSADRREADKAKAQVECIVRDAEDAGKKGRDRLTRVEAELASVEEAITSKEAELMEVVPDWEDKLKEEAEAKERLETAETTLGTLYAKQGRQNQFNTQKERDAHLKSSIASRTDLIMAREQQETGVKRDLSSAKSDLDEVTQVVVELRREMDGRKAALTTLASEEMTMKEEHIVKVEKRK
jgi:structural maintenance of chromosome 3 (chondroitin sulfate proteoglycan 6)